MNNIDFNLTIGLFAVGLGMTIASVIAYFVIRWVRNRAITQTRKQFETRMPFTMEEIEAERELTRAKHVQELRLLELQIADLKVREAEANLKSNVAMGRVSKLNDRIEMLRLELAAKQLNKQVKKVEYVSNLNS
jgi:uncharacterized membrane protein YhiD involved in acid resistance